MKKTITGIIFSLLAITPINGCEFDAYSTISGAESPLALPEILFHLNPEICSTDNGHRMAIWQRTRAAFNGANIQNEETLLQYSFYDPMTNTWTPVNNPAPGAGYIDPSYPPSPSPPPFVQGILQQQAEHCCYPNGNSQIVWFQNQQNPVSGSGPGIVTSLYTVGSGWSSPVTLNTSGASAGSPDIECFDTGEAIAIWVSNTNTVEYSFYNGVFWSSPPVTIDSGGTYGNVRVCVNGPSSAIAIWTDTSGLVNNILSSTFTIPGSWTTPQVISGPFNVDPGIPADLGCDPITGNAIISWAHYIAIPNPQAFGSNYYNGASGTWATAQQIVDPSMYIGVPFISFGPGFTLPRGLKTACVGGDGDGKLVFRALDIVNSLPVVLAISHDGQTGTYSPPVVLHSGINASAHSSPDVCCTNCGDATAIWGYFTNPLGPADLMIASFNTQSQQWSPIPPAPPLIIDTPQAPHFLPTTGEIFLPTLSCNNSGNVFPIWNTIQVDPTITAPSVRTTAGFCGGGSLIPGSLQYESLKSRYPFQSECYCVLRWRTFGCLQGILAYRIYVNGSLEKTVPGSVTYVRLPGLCGRGTEFTVEPVNILGFTMPSQTITVP